ncbi:unnamed protein product [Rotaria sp. Silwood2]|nr:unnamed protein product [Rotaria sp. Silwood2]CAF4366015.1 unnamed protein product [Rotaria sp. Silwood2]
MRPIYRTNFIPYEPDIQQYDIQRDDALNYNYQLKRQCLRSKRRTRRLSSCQCQQVRNVLKIYNDQQASFIVSSIEKQTFE